MLPELETRWDTAAGYRLFSRFCGTAGTGKTPVVLVHGLIMSSLYMVPTARRLAVMYTVYSPDLPGYGYSDKPPKTLSIPALAEVLRAWMDAVGLHEPVYLLANSMGCQTSTIFALRYPERVKKIIMVGPSMDPRTRHPLGLLFRFTTNMLYEPLGYWGVVARDFLAAGPVSLYHQLMAALEVPLEHFLPGVQAPVLVTRGQHDWLVTQPWAEEVARQLPDARLRVLPAASHVSNYDAPDRLVEQVKAFLGE